MERRRGNHRAPLEGLERREQGAMGSLRRTEAGRRAGSGAGGGTASWHCAAGARCWRWPSPGSGPGKACMHRIPRGWSLGTGDRRAGFIYWVLQLAQRAAGAQRSCEHPAGLSSHLCAASAPRNRGHGGTEGTRLCPLCSGVPGSPWKLSLGAVRSLMLSSSRIKVVALGFSVLCLLLSTRSCRH